MSLYGVLSSPSQRRSFLFLSFLLLGGGIVGTLTVAVYAPNTAFWTAVNNLFISVVAGGVFALASALYILYFFVDPKDIEAATTLLPQDIGQALENIAKTTVDYKIFVRTGRHFRSDVLPVLEKNCRKNRLPIRLEVILLDFRNESICKKYANYRNISSFDRKSWDVRYVQQEVLATILKIIEASQRNPGRLKINLFLSQRLSIFRIEGSPDEIVVTREDPKDNAFRYLRSHHNFSAFINEFSWIRDEAFRVTENEDGGLPSSLTAMFGANTLIESLEMQARELTKAVSPYAR